MCHANQLTTDLTSTKHVKETKRKTNLTKLALLNCKLEL